VRDEYNQHFNYASVVIIGDNDEPGRNHARDVAEALAPIAARVRVLDLAVCWPECPPKGDISDWLATGGTRDQLIEWINRAPEYAEPEQSLASRFQPLTLAEFFSLTIKPRGMVLDPIIPEKGLAMVYAVRGTGKTYLVLGIAYAVATGTQFLKWKAPHARRVLLIDGEMPAAALQERLAKIVQGATAEPADDMLTIISGDLIEEGGVGNLADPKVQAEIEPHLEGIELLILDNLSSLTAVIRDNDADSWNPIQAWLLRLRRRGISVLIVHHAGKGGEQRGTSRREDVLDTSISLRRPSDYVPTEGARFEVHLEKARGVHGEPAKPFEAKLEERGSAAVWTMRDIDDANLARVRALLEDGLSVRDIADETGIPKSTVHRLKKKIEGEAGDGE
jgi:putative DNA primase/helicase